ncbi:MAG: sulfatase-like hydrolase/transferase [Sandaracinus sp.]|nr:sulfatase-like hydrolase/transferase [Sandaracinus sp.]
MIRVAALATLVFLVACDDEPAPTATTPPVAEPAAPTEPVVPAEPTPSPAPTGPSGRTYFDLVASSHLADLDRGGAFVAFGTPARHKHTSGTWNSGWGADVVRGDERFTRFGSMGRVYFDVRSPGSHLLRLSIRNVGGGPLLVFLNDAPLGEHVVEPGAFREVVVPVPAEHVRLGENYLLLRGTETRDVDGEAASFEVATLHARHVGGGDAPFLRRGPQVAQGIAREGLAFSPGTTVSWHVEIPRAAHGATQLRFAHASADRLVVRATTDRGDTTELLDAPASEAFVDHAIDLSPLAGKLVRLDFRSHSAEVSLAEARLTLPEVELAALGSTEAPFAKHVIVLLVDTLRADALRVYDPRSRVETPTMDRIAREGVVFENAQSPENWTKPAVASILTSLFPATHGAKNDASRLPHSALTLGEVFQRHGFHTGSFIANGYVSRAFGFDQGWNHYTNYIREQRNTNASNVFGEAAAWIESELEADPQRRLFTYVHTIDPHVPYDPPDDHLRRYDARTDYDGQVTNRRTHLLLEDAKRNPPRVVFTESDKLRLRALYDGEISYHDEHFARFLRRLERLGILDDTIFVVTADHGEEFEDHGSWGHGHSIFQELIEVPLMVRWPGVATAGRRVPEVVSTMGIAPMVLEATGLPVPDEFEGRSLMGFVRGAAPPGPWIGFSDFQENRRVVRGMDWKLVLRSSLTYVLFDLGEDPRERVENLDVGRHPVAMRYLRVLSGQQLGAVDRSRWLEGDSGAGSRVRAETTEMTRELCLQLVALGYMDCTSQFPDVL